MLEVMDFLPIFLEGNVSYRCS